MAKPDTRFKRTTNWLLDLTREQKRGTALTGEESLARDSGVSRTTLRAALGHLEEIGVVERDGRARVVLRKPRKADYFDLSELVSSSDHIQHVFIQRITRRDLVPGQAFSETELAREAGTSPPSVREFLIGFSRFGLIEKKPRGGWRLRPIDTRFVSELADMRDMLEMRAIEQFRAVSADDPRWATIADLAERHRQVGARFEERFSEFPGLDREFHILLVGALTNRFANDFYDIISFIFHYHYQLTRTHEKERYFVGIGEHLAILEALLARDFDRARDKLKVHLGTARRSLLRTIETS